MDSTAVKKLREKLGLGVQDFAKKVGVSRMTVFRWESGQSAPRGLALKALDRLAKRASKLS